MSDQPQYLKFIKMNHSFGQRHFFFSLGPDVPWWVCSTVFIRHPPSISPLFILSRTLHIFKLLYVSYMTQGKVSLSPNPCINFDRPKPAAHVFFLDDWYGSEVTSFGLSGKSQSMLVDGLVSHSMWLSLSFLQEVSNKLHSHEYQWQPYCHH